KRRREGEGGGGSFRGRGGCRRKAGQAACLMLTSRRCRCTELVGAAAVSRPGVRSGNDCERTGEVSRGSRRQSSRPAGEGSAFSAAVDSYTRKRRSEERRVGKEDRCRSSHRPYATVSRDGALQGKRGRRRKAGQAACLMLTRGRCWCTEVGGADAVSRPGVRSGNDCERTGEVSRGSRRQSSRPAGEGSAFSAAVDSYTRKR